LGEGFQVANGHGGKRPGAGRKATRVRFPAQAEAVETAIAEQLAAVVAAEIKVALGGYERVTTTYAPAGTITTGSGEFLSLVFPDKPADELVPIKETRSIAEPNIAALEYLIDRIIGRPTQAIEVDADPDGTLEHTAATFNAAAQELAAWRQQMTDALSNMPSAPPTPPTAATPTD
jgi:hypothetical protein